MILTGVWEHEQAAYECSNIHLRYWMKINTEYNLATPFRLLIPQI